MGISLFLKIQGVAYITGEKALGFFVESSVKFGENHVTKKGKGSSFPQHIPVPSLLAPGPKCVLHHLPITQ